MSGILGWEQCSLGEPGQLAHPGHLAGQGGGGGCCSYTLVRDLGLKSWPGFGFFFTDQSEIPLCSRLSIVSLRSTFLVPLWDPGHAAQGGSYGLHSDEFPLLAC